MKQHVPTVRIHTEPYLSKRAIATIVRDRDFEPLKDILDQEMDRLTNIMDEIDEVDDPDNDNVGFPKPPKDETLSNSLGELYDLLEHFKKQMMLFQLLHKDQIFSWEPPRDKKGSIDWRKEVGRPPVRPFEYPRPEFKMTSGEVEGKEMKTEPNTPFLFRKEQRDTLPTHMSVEQLSDAKMATIDWLEKRELEDNLEYLQALYEQNRFALDTKLSRIPQLWEFFEKPRIKAACEDQGLALS